MAIEDIIKKFRLKKVNPFQGLVIDADTWRDAHNYHRDQQRLHVLAFHQVGIVSGLEVVASNPADLSVNIQPGLAIDPEGNAIAVPQSQRYQLQSGKAGMVYLILQFREVPDGPYQPSENGQPTRLLDAYKIEERDKLPAEPHLELARLDFDPSEKSIRDARNPSRPGKNEINLSFRPQATTPTAAPAAAEKPATPAPEPAAPTPAPAASPPAKETIVLGHAVLGDAANDLHLEGFNNLARFLAQANISASVAANIPLDKDLKGCRLLYLTGSSRFEITEEQQAALSALLQAGGIIFGEGCGEGIKEFGLAFNQLASQLKCKLEIVQRGHPLLVTPYFFAEVPRGAEAPMLLEGGNMIYSGSDYGCAWRGGHDAEPLAREIIRSAFEMGANIAGYARTAKAGG